MCENCLGCQRRISDLEQSVAYWKGRLELAQKNCDSSETFRKYSKAIKVLRAIEHGGPVNISAFLASMGETV